MVDINPNFSALHFGEITFWWKFHENQNKIFLHMHEKLHKMWWKHVFIYIFVQVFMSLYGGHMVQLYAASFLYGF